MVKCLGSLAKTPKVDEVEAASTAHNPLTLTQAAIPYYRCSQLFTATLTMGAGRLLCSAFNTSAGRRGTSGVEGATVGDAGVEAAPAEEGAPPQSERRRKAATAAAFASWPPLAISSKNSRCNDAIALAFATADALQASDCGVPVGGILSPRPERSCAATENSPLSFAAALLEGWLSVDQPEG